MHSPQNLTVIRNRTNKAQPGMFYVVDDSVNISDKSNINFCLAIPTEQGISQYFLCGVYYKTKYNELLQEYVRPM